MLKRGPLSKHSIRLSAGESESFASNTRADLFLSQALKSEPKTSHLTRSQIQELIKKGHILKNDQKMKSSERVYADDTFTIFLPDPVSLEVKAENLSVPILFQDTHLAIIDKPKGMRVHPSGKILTGTLVNALLHQIKNLSGIGGVLRPGIVHRLDKDTSGVMVVSKTDESHQRLSALFAKHELERRYWALCFGAPRVSQGRIESLLARHPKDRKRMSMNVSKGKKAITHYRILERYGFQGKAPFASWVELKLETGRTHQVRVHMMSLGCSLFGDELYGAPQAGQGKWKSLPTKVQECVEALKGQALHARLLAFKHPLTEASMKFESQPPSDFVSLLNALKEFKC